MSCFTKIKSLLALFSQARAVPQNPHLSHFGQNNGVQFAYASVDERHCHIIAELDIRTLGGEVVRQKLSASELREALHSYPASEQDSESCRALIRAANTVQAEDSLLQKTLSEKHPLLPRVHF
jgi:hypothetical protein